MVANMMKAAPDFEFYLYARRPVEIPLAPGNWSLHLDARYARMPYVLWFQNRLPQILADDAIDVFWGQNHMLPLRLRRSCFRLLTVHDLTAVLFPHMMSNLGRVSSRLFYRAAARAADCVLADSQATARLARMCLGVDERRTRVVYLGCENGFGPVRVTQARTMVHERFGLPSTYLLTVGSIEPRKAHLTLLAALEAVPGVPVLAVVGNLGWHCRSIVAAIRRHEQSGRVRFLGPVSDADLAALYSAAKLLIYPSFYEGFGLPILEAMTCGCPALCRWSSSMPEVGGRAAAYFRGPGHGELASEIRRLLRDDAALTAMAEAGSLRARGFSFKRAADQVVGVLREQAT
jgi:glycosyltransferase involved in cell wall biosynthesis